MQANTPTPPTTAQSIELQLLLEEYRAMYALALFRLGALDRRVPIAAATLAAFVGSVAALPAESREIVLVGVPIASIWLVRATVNHARSFEDALRRIELIEQRANRLLNVDVLGFQSQHPSRGHAVGGRTGRESIVTVLVGAVLIVAACWYLFERTVMVSVIGTVSYRLFASVVIASLCMVSRNLTRYRYEPRSWLSDRAESRITKGNGEVK
jgi:hypothetical protein